MMTSQQRVGQAFMAAALCLLTLAARGPAADWPQWRYDAGRRADSPERLPGELHLQWVRELPPPEPAWPFQPRTLFDPSYEPVVAGKTIFVPSMINDSVTALDTDTGAVKWRFYADGPVRFAPIAWRGKVYFGSDDGRLYCVDAADGTLTWAFRGAPSNYKVMGNGRLISAWPLRGGAVLADGRVYVTAGIWPFMGVFAYALDAQTGKVLWSNENLDTMTVKLDHLGYGVSGLSPQGYLAVAGEMLLVPCGGSLPACLDLKTGRLVKYVQEHGYRRQVGHWFVSTSGRYVLIGTALHELTDGGDLIAVASKPAMRSWEMPWTGRPLVTRDAIYALRSVEKGSVICAYDLANAVLTDVKVPVKTTTERFRRPSYPRLWEVRPRSGHVRVHVKAGGRVFAGGPGLVMAVDLPTSARPARASWERRIEGTPSSMLAADGKLFVVTDQGRLYCFGPGETTARTIASPPGHSPPGGAAAPGPVIQTAGVKDGYCLVWGLRSGKLAEDLVAQSALRVIAVDRDPRKITALRKRLDAAGLYGSRVSLHVGDPLDFGWPPYLAGLIVSEDLAAAGFDSAEAFVRTLFRCLRPYGGVACLPVPAERQAAFERHVRRAKLPGAEVRRAGQFALLVRTGRLPHSADWSHNYADAANTLVSADESVKDPLGLLWFGDPPSKFFSLGDARTHPRVAGGRLYKRLGRAIGARDAYTGRVLWTAGLPRVWLGSESYVAAADAVHAAAGRSCFQLDAASGRKVMEIVFPHQVTDVKRWENTLIVSVEARPDSKPRPGGDAAGRAGLPAAPRRVLVPYPKGAARGALVAVDCRSGKMVWGKTEGMPADTAVGGGKAFALFSSDTPAEAATLRRRGKRPKGQTLAAMDLRSGKELWRATEDVFPFGRLSYSDRRDILLQVSNDNRVLARKAADGTVMWKRPIAVRSHFGGSLLLNEDRAIDQRGTAYDLRTGEERTYQDPLTGRRVLRRDRRPVGGCNIVVGSRNLLTLRATTGTYVDLRNGGGARHLGGFRGGCYNSLIAADGILNAPSSATHCGCNYAVRSSLALVHMPALETWTSYGAHTPAGRIRRVGINLGAPGDRKAAGGTLWLEHPPVTGPSPRVPVTTVPETPRCFRRHSCRLGGDGLKWVAASGATGLKSIAITMFLKETAADKKRRRKAKLDLLPEGEGPGKPMPYTVRLFFAEPENLKPGDRVFSVTIQGREVLKDLDVVEAAGGALRPVMREFTGIPVSDVLEIGLKPSETAGKDEPVLCGVEAVARQ